MKKHNIKKINLNIEKLNQRFNQEFELQKFVYTLLFYYLFIILLIHIHIFL